MELEGKQGASPREPAGVFRRNPDWPEFTLSVGRRLVPTSFEKAAFGFDFQRSRGKRDGTLPIAWNFDLSTTEWVELGAVAQLLLCVLHYANNGIDLRVELPNPARLPGETELHRALDRAASLRFLEYLQFPDRVVDLASQAAGRVEVCVGGRPWAKATSPYVMEERYKRIVPLRWIALEDEKGQQAVLGQLVSAAHNAGIGIEAIDAEALASVVLYELIENVAVHSGRLQPALICAFAHKPNSEQFTDDFLPDERPYLESIASYGQHLLEVIVGDAGEGIVDTLMERYKEVNAAVPGALTKNLHAPPHKVIEWALDRWSSSRRDAPELRGVRGLFRIDRIAKKYQGQISIRTHKALFVRDHTYFGNHHDWYQKAPNAHSYFHGTLVRARLVPSHAARLVAAATQQPAPADRLPSPNQRVHVENVHSLHDGGLPQATRQVILHLISLPATIRPELLALLYTGEEKYDKEAVELALEFLALHASPVPLLALNFPGSEMETVTSVLSVNSELERRKETRLGGASPNEGRDLFAVVSPAGRLQWVGIDPTVSQVLDQVPSNGEESLVPTKLLAQLRTSSSMLPAFFILEHVLESMPPLLKISCKIDLGKVADVFESSLLEYIAASPAPKGVWRGDTYLTPALQYVHTWINVADVFDAAPAPLTANAVLGLALRMRQQFGSVDNISFLPTFGTCDRLRRKLVKALGVKELTPLEFDSIRPPRMPVGSPELLIYIDIISTEEAARRTIQIARKQRLNVVGIVCLIDARPKRTSTIKVLGDQIPMVSFCHLPTACQPSTRFEAISPTLRWLEQLPESGPTRADANNDPLARIDGLLQFGHSKRPNGRHLTLTPIVDMLLQQPELESFITNSIREFVPAEAAPNVVAWAPIDSRDPPERADLVEDLLRTAFQRAQRQVSSIHLQMRVTLSGSVLFHHDHLREGHLSQGSLLVIFDWGVITGASLQALVTAGISQGATKILVLVGSNQLGKHERTFLASVNRLHGQIILPRTNLVDPPEVLETEANFDFRSFSEIRMGQFQVQDCPVCRQITDLGSLQRSDPFLESFIEYVINKLDNYPGAKVNPLDTSQRARRIGIIRNMLHEALTSTLDRKKVYDWLVRTESDDAKLDESISLIELLFVEDHWLRSAPLQFRECRKLIAKMCVSLVGRTQGEFQAIAVAVLRKVSKTEFVARSFDLFAQLATNRLAQQALLSGLHTYIARDYHQGPALAEDASKAIREIHSSVKASSVAPSQTIECWGAVTYLKSQIDFLSSRASRADRAPPELMAELKEILRDEHNYNPHTEAATAAKRLTGTFEEVVGRLLKAPISDETRVGIQGQLDRRYRNLETCQDFLLARVVPLMVHLQREFTSPSFVHLCQSSEASWLRQFLTTHASGLAPMRLRAMLDRIKSYILPTHGASREEVKEVLAAYVSEARILRNVLLLAERKEATGNLPPSMVGKFLDMFPSSLNQALTSAQVDFRVSIRKDIWNCESDKVYCPTELLARVVDELLENAEKHSSDGVLHVSLNAASDKVVLSAWNIAKAEPEQKAGRHGLTQCAVELALFGGRLSHDRKGRRHQVVVELSPWRAR